MTTSRIATRSPAAAASFSRIAASTTIVSLIATPMSPIVPIIAVNPYGNPTAWATPRVWTGKTRPVEHAVKRRGYGNAFRADPQAIPRRQLRLGSRTTRKSCQIAFSLIFQASLTTRVIQLAIRVVVESNNAIGKPWEKRHVYEPNLNWNGIFICRGIRVSSMRSHKTWLTSLDFSLSNYQHTDVPFDS